MVSFTCDACGQTVRKNQVEKHYQNQCRSCSVLSCIDCGKDFPGDAYKSHTSCISEAEKYQGHLYKAKEGGNKGETKQKEWMKQVQDATGGIADPRLKSLLEKIAEYSNVPRKKKKFENFCKNSIRIYDQKTLEQLWEAFMGDQAKPNSNEAKKEEKSPENNDSTKAEEKTETESNEEENEEEDKKVDDKKNKVSKKEKRKRKLEEKENGVVENGVSEHETKKKKKKKRENAEGKSEEVDAGENSDKKKNKRVPDNGEDASEVISDGSSKKKKKKKNVNGEVADTVPLNNTLENGEDENKNPGKFHWHKAIKTALRESEDHSLSMKKLRKKVLSAYQEHGMDHRASTIEECRSLFDKKLHTYPKVKISKDNVTLVK